MLATRAEVKRLMHHEAAKPATSAPTEENITACPKAVLVMPRWSRISGYLGDEVDHYWTQLSEGGAKQAQQCGWLKDQFGVSWQIVPTIMIRLLADPDPVKSQRVMKAMMGMKKIDIAEIKRAYAA